MNLKIPNTATGRVIPHSVQKQIRNEEGERRLRKQQYRHDWKIAIFNTLGGAVAGLITSIIFWLITE